MTDETTPAIIPAVQEMAEQIWAIEDAATESGDKGSLIMIQSLHDKLTTFGKALGFVIPARIGGAK